MHSRSVFTRTIRAGKRRANALFRGTALSCCTGLLVLALGGCGHEEASAQGGLSTVAVTATSPELPASPFCEIEQWGPQQVHAGERFNTRLEGSSAFWFRTSCAPARVMLLADGQLIETSRRPPNITASFNADGLLQQPGEHELAFYDPDTRSTWSIGTFQVLPALKPVDLPPAPPRIWPAPATRLDPPVLIAHAGGSYLGIRYPNSLEALDHNYALGHRFFELDFSWTKDMQLVAIHDWQQTYARLFPSADHATVPDRATFVQAEMKQKQTPLDLPRLRQWLAAHPDAHVVTDIRGRDVYGLKVMKGELGEQSRQVIPQMYHPDNYPDIRALGYEHVIFTLYATSMDTQSLLDFIRTTPLFAITLNPAKPDAGQIIAGLAGSGTFIYVHTFNKVEELNQHRAAGANGVYTDFLYQDAEGRFARQ